MRQERTQIDWTSFILVFAMITIVLWAVIAADWTDNLYTIWVVAVGGMLAGLPLAASRFKATIAHVFSFVYGLAWEAYWLTWLVSQTEDTFHDRLVEIYYRVGTWLWQVTHNEVSSDSMLFILWMSFLAWWMAYFAVWYSQRINRVWRVVLPISFVLLVNVYYFTGGSLTIYLLLFLIAALLVVARSYAALQEQDWRKALVGFSPDFRFDLLQAGFTVALIAVLVGWAVPAAAGNEQVVQLWRRVEGPWRNVEDTWSRIFSSLRSRGPVYANPFGRFLALQGARVVGDALVMDVQSSKAHYWRATAYNQYTGSGWVATDITSRPIESYAEVYSEKPYSRQPVTQTFTLRRPAVNLLFAASQPSWFDVPARIDGWADRDGGLDPALLATNRTFAPGKGYQVISLASDADVSSLRQAGENYPEWVRQTFTALPDSLPERVVDLAQSITAAYDTPYDKAAAIELWMRANVVYDDQINAPPAGRDVVDYLLFDSKRGYCDYYASGMAVLARAVGLPARVVGGYAQGTFDSNIYTYHVQEKDSHSWVEIYFPRYGWIEFEPTTSRPVVARPTPPPPTPTPNPDDPNASLSTRMPHERDFEDPNPLANQNPAGAMGAGSSLVPRWLIVSLVVVGALILAVAGLLIWSGFDSWSLNPTEAVLLAVSSPRPGAKSKGERPEPRSLYGLNTIQRAYSRLMRLAGWLGLSLSPHHTPNERGELFGSVVPDGRPAISTIVNNYALEQYGRGMVGGDDSRQAWESVRTPIWYAGLRQRQERIKAFWAEKIDALRRFSSQFGGG